MYKKRVQYRVKIWLRQSSQFVVIMAQDGVARCKQTFIHTQLEQDLYWDKDRNGSYYYVDIFHTATQVVPVHGTKLDQP